MNSVLNISSFTSSLDLLDERAGERDGGLEAFSELPGPTRRAVAGNVLPDPLREFPSLYCHRSLVLSISSSEKI